MKAARFLAITVILIISLQSSYSQISCADSVQPGKVYKLELKNGSSIECEIKDRDSNYLIIKNINGVIGKIPKEYIENITAATFDFVQEYQTQNYGIQLEDSGEKYKPSLSLSGGLGLTPIQSSRSFPSSFLLNIEGILYLSRRTALRININSNFLGNPDNRNIYESYSHVAGGKEYINVIILDLLIGNLRPEENTNHYFTIGLGTLIYSESERTTYYNDGVYSYNYTGSGGSFPIPGLEFGYGLNHRFSPNLTAGFELLHGGLIPLIGGLISVKPKLNYKLSKNFSMFVEPQYTFTYLIDDKNSFPIDEGYFTIKGGITLGSF